MKNPSKEKNLHEKHRKRLREQFLENGAEGLTEVQLLELLLTFSIPRQDTNPHAHRLMDHFEGYRGVMEADYADLLEVEGIGPSSALLIMLASGLNRHYLNVRHGDRAQLKTGDEICGYVRDLFRYRPVEEAYLICLDGERRVISRSLLGTGSVTEVGLTPREVVQIALRKHAASVVLTHNHLAELAIPSRADIETTRLLYRGLRLIGVELLDHVIVADDDCVSMRDSGMFDDF